ncbi:unnamed protein product, partial [Ectocarpus sp. 12 AP-2014]
APPSSYTAHRGSIECEARRETKRRPGSSFSLSVHPNKETGLRSEEREAVKDPRLCGGRYFNSPKRIRETMEKPPSSSRPAAANSDDSDDSGRNNVKGHENSTDDSSSDSG